MLGSKIPTWKSTYIVPTPKWKIQMWIGASHDQELTHFRSCSKRCSQCRVWFGGNVNLPSRLRGAGRPRPSHSRLFRDIICLRAGATNCRPKREADRRMLDRTGQTARIDRWLLAWKSQILGHSEPFVKTEIGRLIVAAHFCTMGMNGESTLSVMLRITKK